MRRLLLVALCATGCDNSATVLVEHQLGEGVLVRNVRFSGCVWGGMLDPGKRTAPGQCLSGRERVYFELFDVGQNRWTGVQTTTVFDVLSGSTRVLRLEANANERDLSAPGPFGH